MNFESSVYVSEELNRQMVNVAKELAERSIRACAEHYNFDADEAVRLLDLENVKMVRGRRIESSVKSKKEKIVVSKPCFPLPYNGEFNEKCCYALRQNNGLYTQCQGVQDKSDFCKQCQALADKDSEGIPEYGTIQMRQAVGIFEYIDPKGRKPVAYTKVMKKYKITQEQAVEEAGKFNININAEHFVVPEGDSKRGRPASKGAVEKVAKGSKGRPKKVKKVLEIDGDDEDLFAALVADANAECGEMESKSNTSDGKKKGGKSDEEKEAERLAKEAEKAQEKEAKKLALENAKAEKEAKLAAEKAEKEALAKQKKESERLAREEKKKAEEEEKLAKKAALKKEKEAAKANKSKKAPAEGNKEPAEDEEPDVVKKIEFEGKKYLKSKKSGIIYDYQEYVKNGEQVMVGKWNESKNKIDFNKAADEESEEEYDM